MKLQLNIVFCHSGDILITYLSFLLIYLFLLRKHRADCQEKTKQTENSEDDTNGMSLNSNFSCNIERIKFSGTDETLKP